MAYTPQYAPYGLQQPFYQPPAQRTDVVRVNGRGGAEAFSMAPNSSIILLDETAPIVWLKTTDGAGYPTLTPYDISPHKDQEAINLQNMQSLEERISRLEAVINESNAVDAQRVSGSSGKRGSNKTDVQSAQVGG